MENAGKSSQLFLSEVLRDFDELPCSCGIVILGGWLLDPIVRLMHPVLSRKEYMRMVFMGTQPPHFGVLEFEASGRPGIWIAGLYPWNIVSAVKHWLDTDGVERFVERLCKR